MVNIVAKYVGDTLIGYYGHHEDRTVFLDLAVLKFWPNPFSPPVIMSWEGFPEESKFCNKLYRMKISIDISLEDVEKIMTPYLTRVDKYGKMEETSGKEELAQMSMRKKTSEEDQSETDLSTVRKKREEVTITSKIKAEAEELLGKDYKYFYEVDPFNPGNTLEGLIGIRNGSRYGALYITAINGYPTKQLIYATPKLKYPFDRAGRYVFPSAKKIEAYTKLDGTNVFMYQYSFAGSLFTTFKVRLRPFIANGRFGDFLNMWKTVLQRYPNIPKLFQGNPHVSGFSFELYGSLNKHLIEYETALEPALLFGIQGEGEIVPLSDIKDYEVPSAGLEQTVTRDYVWSYQSTQKEIDEGLKETDSGFTGQEGQVWYLLDKDDKYHMFKLKPETIENIHWASVGIPKLIIKATAYNVLETESDITVKALEQLLLEEFTKEQIAASSYRIQHVVDEVNEELQFRERVSKAFATIVRPGIRINRIPSLPDIMRGLSPHFERREMSTVYSYTVAILESMVGKEKVDELKTS